MTEKMTELEELGENLRKAWFYANKASEIGEDADISNDIFDKLLEAEDHVRYASMAIEAEIEEIEKAEN